MKKILILCLSLVFVISIAACGNSNSDNKNTDANANVDTSTSNSAPAANNTASETPAPVATGEKVHITYWTDDRHDQEYIKEVISEFNASNPDNIEVELIVLAENYGQSIDIAFTSDQAPDVLRLKSGNTEGFVKKGYLAPLNSYLDDAAKAKYDGMFIKNVNQFNDEIYSLPNTGLTLRLVYNQDLFKQAGITSPPASLQDMVNAAKAITEAGKKDGIYGFALNFKNPKSAFDRSIREILSLSGHQGLGFDLKTGKYDFAPYSQVIEYFKQMYDDGSIMPGAESLDIDPLRAQFAAGKIGMYMSFSTEPGVYQDQFPTEINWAGALAPTIDGTQVGTSEIVSAGTWLGISSKSEHQDAAAKFILYMHGDDIMKTYHEKGFGIAIVPSIAAVAANPETRGMEGFLVGDKDSLWPTAPTVTPEGGNYGDAFFKYVLTGGDLNAIVEDLNKRYNAALDAAVAKGDITVTPNPSFNPSQPQAK